MLNVGAGRGAAQGDGGKGESCLTDTGLRKATLYLESGDEIRCQLADTIETFLSAHEDSYIKIILDEDATREAWIRAGQIHMIVFEPEPKESEEKPK